MKKRILIILPMVLTACSTPVQQSSVPMDMKTVEQYQQSVSIGKVVKANQDDTWELDQSDKRKKVIIVEPRASRVYPSVHYGYGWGRHYTGLGIAY